MAVEKSDSNYVFGKDESENTGTNRTTKQQAVSPVSGFGFGRRKAMLLGGNSPESDLMKLFETIGVALENVEGVNAEVNVYSKNTFTNLEYSALVVSVEESKKRVFFTLLIEATGTNHVTPESFLENVYQNRLAFVPTDAVNDRLFETIIEDMRTKSPDVEFIPLDGIMPRSEVDIKDKDIGEALGSEAFNTCILFLKKALGELPEIDLKVDLREANGDLTVSEMSYTESAADIFGNKRYVNWGLDLMLSSRDKQTVVNARGNTVSMASIKGHIQFVPTVTPENTQSGPIERKSIYPIIVTSVIETEIPTLSYALMAISLSSLMADGYRWINPVIANLSPGKDAGVFNKFVNIINEQKPKAFDLSDKKRTRKEKSQLISQMVSNTPVIALEIQAFGENTASLSAFSVAASNTGSSEKAKREIINTLVEMTSGEFPANFNQNDIFGGAAAVMPDGYFVDKKGVERSLSEIDLMYMLSLGGEKAEYLTNRYIRNELGLSQDSFVDTLEIYKELDINAVITGRKTRVFFSSVFINTMVNAFKACGLSPRVDTQSIISEEVGYGFSNQLLQNAGMHGNVGFGTEFAGANYGNFSGINIGRRYY